MNVHQCYLMIRGLIYRFAICACSAMTNRRAYGLTDELQISAPWKRNVMNRPSVLLAVLSASGGHPFQPVQIQKAMFLVSQNLPGLVTAGPKYSFAPYDYGPFDSTVYNDARVLQAAGLARIADASNGRWSTYSATDHGLERGTKLLDRMTKGQRKYILDVAAWVRKLSFSALVKSIYDAYPKMRENSIFEG